MIEQERRNNNQLIQLKVKTMNGMLYFVQLQYNGTVASLQAQIEEVFVILWLENWSAYRFAEAPP